jgi:hypothetical protein
VLVRNVLDDDTRVWPWLTQRDAGFDVCDIHC